MALSGLALKTSRRSAYQSWRKRSRSDTATGTRWRPSPERLSTAAPGTELTSSPSSCRQTTSPSEQVTSRSPAGLKVTSKVVPRTPIRADSEATWTCWLAASFCTLTAMLPVIAPTVVRCPLPTAPRSR